MNTMKAPIGKRIGASVLDSMFMWIIMLAALVISPLLGGLAMMVTSVLCFGISEGSSLHASPGKHLCGLKVVDRQGMSLTYRKSFIRSLCRLLSGMVFGVGYLIGLFDKQGRTLHDRMAGTLVIEEGAGSVNSYPQSDMPQMNGMNQNMYDRSNINISAKVIGVTGQFAGRSFPVSEQGIMMGRDQSACDFVFPENQAAQGISRAHCKIQYNPQTQMFILYDLGSSYGTFLGNGTRVVQGQPVALRSGEEFYLAARTVTFRVSL